MVEREEVSKFRRRQGQKGALSQIGNLFVSISTVRRVAGYFCQVF